MGENLNNNAIFEFLPDACKLQVCTKNYSIIIIITI